MPVFRRSRRAPAAAVEGRIRTALGDLQPLLGAEAFTVDLLRFDESTRIAHLRVEGDCPDCEMTAGTLVPAIEAHLRRRVPEVESVQAGTGSDA